MKIGLILGLLIVVLAVLWWFVGRNTPNFPPLEISEDDPLMLEAMEKAKSTIGEFLELLNGEYSEAQVKVPFTSSSEVVEHLWAEVIEINDNVLSVLYYTPPVTHDGKLDRVHKHDIAEIEDWAVFMKNGKIHGGFTQRVMFKLGREQWGELPPELEHQESLYVD